MPSPYWQLRDAHWLSDEYLGRGRTGRELAAEIGCHPTTLDKALHRHGIRRPPHRTMASVPAEWLREQHVARGRSTHQIADELGVAARSVQRALADAGIPVNDRRLPAELDDLSWLAAHDSLDRAEIARMLGCSPDAVTRARRRHGLRDGAGSRIPRLDDRAWLEERYHARGWSQQRIADTIGCSRSAGTQAMQRLGITSRPRRQPQYPELQDREWVAKHIEAGRSPAQIAALLGCDRTTVTDAQRRLGLRPDQQRR